MNTLENRQYARAEILSSMRLLDELLPEHFGFDSLLVAYAGLADAILEYLFAEDQLGIGRREFRGRLIFQLRLVQRYPGASGSLLPAYAFTLSVAKMYLEKQLDMERPS